MTFWGESVSRVDLTVPRSPSWYRGILPKRIGARVDFSGDDRVVTDGPFTETKGLIAGFWIIQEELWRQEQESCNR